MKKYNKHNELEGKKSIQIVDLMKKIAFKVAWGIFFGLTEQNEKDNKMLEDFTTAVKGSFAVPINFPGTTFHKAMKARARLRERLSELIRIKKGEMELKTHDNFLTRLVNLRDENGEMLEEEVMIDVFFSMVAASHDSTAVLMTHFIRHLCRDNEVYNKVLEEQEEVEKIKGESEDGRVSWKEIQMMKYTWRVARELMRITPPILANFRQTTRDISLDGFDIPKGWQILLVPAGTHMNEKIFEDPNKFDPSRFENSKQSYPPYTYVAFGAGPRICPGAEFARIEAMLVIHHLVTKYEWKEIVANEPISYNPMPYPAMGLPVKFNLKNKH
ncbi:beta-amyrin 28-monooxygenase-like [Euphorbia lathyris]|uniref:beta-amyrin 28-monooxygenase-like n=1 Tax=Euphorbia lathyris TaxID=212925 RepID=UPI0033131A1F